MYVLEGILKGIGSGRSCEPLEPHGLLTRVVLRGRWRQELYHGEDHGNITVQVSGTEGTFQFTSAGGTWDALQVLDMWFYSTATSRMFLKSRLHCVRRVRP